MAQDYLKILNKPAVVAWAKQNLKKQDRIVWYLKQVEEYPLVHPSENLLHYYGMDIPEINNFVPTSETESQLCAKFQEFEDQYLDKLKATSRLIPFNREDKSVLYLGDDWHWFLLKRPYCREEGKAMGHCGNSSGRKTDRLLSLRKVITRAGRYFFEPHATFILLKDKQLGEMKGRQNKKPDSKYHPYIVELLNSDLIRGIKGGGYLPENNFDLSDLSEELLQSFLKTSSHKLDPVIRQVIESRHNPEFILPQRVANATVLNNCLRWVKSEEELLRVSLVSKFAPLRVAAINRLNNQEYLFKILNERKDFSSKHAACERIHEEELLANIFFVYGKNDSFIARSCVQRVYDKDLLLKFLNETDARQSVFDIIVEKVHEVIPELFFSRNFTRLGKQILIAKSKYNEDFWVKVVLKEEDLEIQLLALSKIGTQKTLQDLLTAQELPLEIKVRLVKLIWDKNFLIENLAKYSTSETEAKLSDHLIDQIGMSSLETQRDALLEKLHQQTENEEIKAYARFKMTHKGRHLITETSITF